MENIFLAIIGSSVLAACITQVGNILVNRLNRKDKTIDDNNDVLEAIGEIKRDIDTLRTDLANTENAINDRIDTGNAVQARARILIFGDEISHKQRHSREHYSHIMRDIKDYETFCESHPDFENDIATSTTSLIRKDFQERLDQNDFL